MKKTFLLVVTVLLSFSFATAQTAEELKAERQQLKAELKSKDYTKLEKKYKKIVVDGVVKNQPSGTGLNSVDGLVNTDASLLNVLISAESILEKYKTDITESNDGEVDITKYKASSDDYVATLPNLMEAAKQAIDAAKQLQAVKDDVKGLNPASAAQTIKAANWAMDALPVITDKITMDVKLLNNLINSIKASSNL